MPLWGTPMVSRQTEHGRRRRAAGLCAACTAETFVAGQCFRHTLLREFHKHGMACYTRRYPKAWRFFLNGMSARFERILRDEGFMVDAISEPQELIRLAEMTWARGRLRKKVLAVIARFDDMAIRRRFLE